MFFPNFWVIGKIKKEFKIVLGWKGRLRGLFFFLIFFAPFAYGININSFYPAGLTATWDTTNAAGILNGSGSWNVDSTLFTYNGGASNSPFCQGCNVVFGTGTGTAGTVTITGTQRINSFLFNTTPSGNYILSGGILSCINSGPSCTYTANQGGTIGSNISGSKNLIKNGNGNLTLSADNSFTGTVDINAGTLTLSSPGPTYIVYKGGQININGASTLSVVSTGGNNRYDFPSGQIFNFNNVGGGTISTGSGLNWVQAGNWNFATNGGATNLIGGLSSLNMNTFQALFSVIPGLDPISDLDVTIALGNSAQGITKTGGGILRLSGTNSYTGTTTVSAGTLSLGNGVATGNIIPTTNLITNNATLTYDTPSTITHSGIISGTGSFNKYGTGVLTLTAANTYLGGTNVFAGTLQETTTVSAFPGNVAIATGATAWLNVTGTPTHSNTFSGAGTLKVTAGGTGLNTTALSGNLSGLTGTLDVFPSASGGGKVNLTNGTQANTMPAGSLVRVQPGGTIFYPSALNYPASVQLNGGATGEAFGNLRVDNGNVTGPVSLLANSSIGLYLNTGTISGVISGTGFGFTREGSGNLILTNNNTYTGTTTITGGTLTLGDGTTTGNIIPTANLITNNAALVYNTPSTITHSGTISGTGSLRKDGAGTLTITNSNPYTGATTVSAGTLSLSMIANDQNASSGYAISTGATLNVVVPSGQARISQTNPTISGAGTFSKTSANTLYMANNSATPYQTNFNMSAGGLVDVQGGTLSSISTAAGNLADININTGAAVTINDAGASNATAFFDKLSGAGNISQNANVGARTLSVGNNNGTATFTGIVGNSASGGVLSFTKTGTGTQTLTGVNTYTGATTISSGTLQIDGAGSLNSGSYAGAISNSGTFKYSSSADQTLSGAITGTGALTKDTSAASTLTLTSGTTNYTGATTVFTGTLALTDTIVFASPITNNGTLNLNRSVAGFTNRKAIAANAVTGTGTLNINAAANSAGTTDGGWVIFGGNTGSYAGTGPVNINSGVLSRDNVQTNTINSSSDYTVAANAVFAAGRGGNSTIGGLNGAGTVSSAWTTGSTGSITFGSGNKSGTFSGAIRGNGNTTDGNIDGGILNVIKTGTGIQTLSGANTYSGTTTVNGGTLKLTTTGTLTSSTITIASGAVLELDTSGGNRNSGTQTFNGTGTLRKTGANSAVWGGSIGTFALGTGGSIDIQGGVFTGGSGANEVWTTNLSDLNVESGATFNGVEENIRVDALTGNGTITSGLNHPRYTIGFTFGVDGGSGTFSGVLADGAFAGKYIKEGAGTQTLTGVNTYTGTTTISGGTLTFGNGTTAGNLIPAANLITNNANLVYNTPSTITHSGVISGTGNFTKDGTGTLTLTATNTYTGATTVSGGTLSLGDGTTTNDVIPLNSSITNNSNLIFNLPVNKTYSGTISGTGVVIKRGIGTLSMPGANSFSGGVIVSQGTWSQSDNLSSGTGPVSLGDANTGTNNIAWTFQGGGQPRNPITVNNLGTGTVTIATNSGGLYTNHNALMTLNRAVIFNDSTGDRTTFGGIISGTVGTITISGSRVTIDNPANNFVGNIIISNGSALQNNSQTALPTTTNVTINGNGAFRFNNGGTHTIGGFDSASSTSGINIIAGGDTTISFGHNNAGGTFAGLISNGSNILSLIKNGTGTQILSGNNTFTGGISLKGGTIRAGHVNGFGTGAVTCAAPCTAGTCTVNRGGFATPNTITTNGLCTIVN